MTIKQCSGVSVKADSFHSLLSSFLFKFLYRQHYKENLFFFSFGGQGFSHRSLHPSPLRPRGYFSFLQPARCECLFFFFQVKKEYEEGSVSTLHKSLPMLSHLLSFQGFTPFPPSLCGQTKPGSPWRPLGTGDGSSCASVTVTARVALCHGDARLAFQQNRREYVQQVESNMRLTCHLTLLLFIQYIRT